MISTTNLLGVYYIQIIQTGNYKDLKHSESTVTFERKNLKSILNIEKDDSKMF